MLAPKRGQVYGYAPFQTLEIEARKGPGMSLNGEPYLRIKYRKSNIMKTNGIQNTGSLAMWEPTSGATNAGCGLMSAIAMIGFRFFFEAENLKAIS
jgi:hypothetical protein